MWWFIREKLWRWEEGRRLMLILVMHVNLSWSGRYSLVTSIYRVHIQTLLMEEKSDSPEYTSVGYWQEVPKESESQEKSKRQCHGSQIRNFTNPVPLNNTYSQIIRSGTRSADPWGYCYHMRGSKWNPTIAFWATDLVLAKREKPEWSIRESEEVTRNCNKTLHSNQNFNFPFIELSQMAKPTLHNRHDPSQ